MFAFIVVRYPFIVDRDEVNEVALEARDVALDTRDDALDPIEVTYPDSVETSADKFVLTSVFRFPRYVLNVVK